MARSKMTDRQDAPTPQPAADVPVLLRYLNPMMEREDALRAYASTTKFPGDLRSRPTLERLTYLDEFKTIMTPRPEYADLYVAVELALRAGYKSRHPESAIGRQHLYRPFPEARSFHGNGNLCAGGSFMVMGVTGAGKSSWALKTTTLQPTLIDLNRLTHGEYPYLQVPLLYVRSPSEPTVQGMVHAFLDALGLATGDWAMIEANRRAKFSTTNARQTISRLCSTYFVGLIIWDEFQAIVNANTRGNDVMNNFLMYIRDTAQVPMMYVGNYEMWTAIESNALILRRSTNSGARWLDRFESSDDRYWQLMVETYWKAQIVRNPSPLTDKIRALIYDYTQGMPDYLRSLMVGAHRVALIHGVEKINAEVLQEAWDVDCAANHGPVAALKSGNMALLKKYTGLLNPAKLGRR